MYTPFLKTSLRFHAVALAAVLLAACAQSPQQIKVAPVLPTPASATVNQLPVHIRVSDQRDNKVLGTRGGAYRDTAVITLENDLSTAVQAAMKSHMTALGYDTDSLGADTVDLHIVFDELVYTHPEQEGMGHDMDMLAVVRAEASRGVERYEGRYRIKRQQKFFNAPSVDKNAEMLNALVVEVLENLLADKDLTGFFAGK